MFISPLAALGAVLVIVGVNAYKMVQTEEYKQLATLAFVAGWMVVAAAIAGVAAQTVLAFGSAMAVVLGALLMRGAAQPSGMAMALFLGGWAGITLAMAWRASTAGEMLMVVVASLLTVGGVYLTSKGEKEGNKATLYAGRGLFVAGWVGVAIAVGLSSRGIGMELF